MRVPNDRMQLLSVLPLLNHTNPRSERASVRRGSPLPAP
jgi:hypothetical protein